MTISPATPSRAASAIDAPIDAPIDAAIRTVMVTGAAGFIGRAVADALHAAGLEVVRLDRDHVPPYPVSTRAAAIDLDVRADLAVDDVSAAIADVDAIVHLAGTPGVQTSWSDGFEHHVRNNLLATQRLCEAAVSTGCRRMVVASSSSVYGNVATGVAHESDPLAPLSPYGASKAAVEHLIGAYAARGLSVAALRYFTVFGPWQRPDMAIHRLFRAALGGPAFPLRSSGEQLRSFTYVADVADATVRAVQRHTTSDVFNVAGEEVVSLNELIDRVQRLTGRAVPIERLPPAAGDPGRTAADVSRARAELGWRSSTTIADGLAAQWAWHVGDRDAHTATLPTALAPSAAVRH